MTDPQFPHAISPSRIDPVRDNDSVVLIVEVERAAPLGRVGASARYEFRMSEVMATDLFDQMGVATGAWSADE